MMEQIILEDGGPHPPCRPESMEAVVVQDRRGQPQVDNTSCGLPQELH